MGRRRYSPNLPRLAARHLLISTYTVTLPAASCGSCPVCPNPCAGSGKTTLMQRLCSHVSQHSIRSYVINLDPAVLSIPYPANIDIRDTVNYKNVMKEYRLGPNGGIVTSLNLFSTKIHEVCLRSVFESQVTIPLLLRWDSRPFISPCSFLPFLYKDSPPTTNVQIHLVEKGSTQYTCVCCLTCNAQYTLCKDVLSRRAFCFPGRFCNW